MRGDRRDGLQEVLHERLAALRQVLVPGILLGTVRAISDLDLSLSHLATLYVLQRHGTLTVNQVAEVAGASLPRASRMVDHLVGHGLVSRQEDQRDRRARRVSVTAEGRELLRAFERNVTEAQFGVIADLPPEDQATIVRAIDLMARAAADRENAEP